MTASEDKQRGNSVRNFRFDLKESLAHRNACHLAVGKILASLFEMHGRGRDEAGNQAIGESGNYVGLEGQRGDAAANGRQHGGARGVASDSDDDVGPEVGDDAACGPEGARQIEHGFRACHEADIF